MSWTKVETWPHPSCPVVVTMAKRERSEHPKERIAAGGRQAQLQFFLDHVPGPHAAKRLEQAFRLILGASDRRKEAASRGVSEVTELLGRRLSGPGRGPQAPPEDGAGDQGLPESTRAGPAPPGVPGKPRKKSEIRKAQPP